jgi:hypothetical protein
LRKFLEDEAVHPNFNNENTEKAKKLLNLMKADEEFKKDESEINKVLEKLEKKRIWVEKNVESFENWLDSLHV